MKIIFFSFGGIGNTLLLTPALRALRGHYPKAHLSALVMFQGSFDLLKNNSAVDELLICKFLEEGPWRSFFFLLRLRKRRFDISILGFPANRWEYNVIGWLVGAKRRLGHRYRHRDRRNLNFLQTDTALEDDRFHDAEENLRLIEMLGAKGESPPRLEIFLTSDERKFAEGWLETNGLLQKPLIGFHAGSALFKNQAKRRWSPAKFAELAALLISQYRYTVLLFGSKEDEETNRKICDTVLGLHRVEGTTITQTAALIGRCLLFVTNDSSLMHIAAALSVPTAAIFGPTSPVRVRPLQTHTRIIRKDLSCSPCFYYSPKPLTCYRKEKDYACLEWIETRGVLEEVLSLLEELPPREGSHV